jgi:hypothetical protein
MQWDKVDSPEIFWTGIDVEKVAIGGMEMVSWKKEAVN